MPEKMHLRQETLNAHGGWVTSIAVYNDNTVDSAGISRQYILTASRDKTVLIWEPFASNGKAPAPKASLLGHNHIVNEVTVCEEKKIAATASNDRTIRIWDLTTYNCLLVLQGHTNDVNCVAFVGDAMVVSGSRDKSIRFWNTTNGNCIHVIENAHNNWVSSLRTIYEDGKPVIISSGWDKKVKLWDVTNFREIMSCVGDEGYVSAIAVSQDGSICASGGKMGKIHLWDLSEKKYCLTLDAGEGVNAVCFSPKNYWLCAAAPDGLKVWDISSGPRQLEHIVIEIPNPQHQQKYFSPQPISLTWNTDGTLFVGYTDNTVRIIES